MKTTFYILTTLLLLSCSIDNKSKLIGEWYRLDEWINTGEIDSIPRGYSVPRPPIYYPFGYDFKTNDSVEYFLGVWQKTKERPSYLGQYRHYKIKGDSLIIFGSEEIPYKTYRIVFLNDDTISFCKNGTFLTFVRFKSEIKNYIQIDSIKISHRDGWGTDINYKVTSNCDISYSKNSYQYDGDLKDIDMVKLICKSLSR